jgi:hypothetical protein
LTAGGGDKPELSVVVAGSRPQGPPEEIFEVLRSGLETGRYELLLATTRPPERGLPPATRVLSHAQGTTLPELRLAGVRAARADVIALTEDFCAPVVGWPERLLEAHRRLDAVAVGGPVGRRRGSAAHWALTLVEYGRFFRTEPEAAVEDLPSINVAYSARELHAALPETARGLFEVDVHERLRAAGGRFFRVHDALVFDENTVPLAGARRAQFNHGRLFAAGRVRGRRLLPRLARFVLAPLVPAVLMGRIARGAWAAGATAPLLRALPQVAVLLAAWSAGEAVGSLLGEGDSAARWT